MSFSSHLPLISWLLFYFVLLLDLIVPLVLLWTKHFRVKGISALYCVLQVSPQQPFVISHSLWVGWGLVGLGWAWLQMSRSHSRTIRPAPEWSWHANGRGAREHVEAHESSQSLNSALAHLVSTSFCWSKQIRWLSPKSRSRECPHLQWRTLESIFVYFQSIYFLFIYSQKYVFPKDREIGRRGGELGPLTQFITEMCQPSNHFATYCCLLVSLPLSASDLRVSSLSSPDNNHGIQMYSLEWLTLCCFFPAPSPPHEIVSPRVEAGSSRSCITK